MNYRYIWERQSIPDFLVNEILELAFIVRKTIVSGVGNIETFCKKKECWEDHVIPIPYSLGEKTKQWLLTAERVKTEKTIAKKEQKFSDGITTEIQVFNFGAEYWQELMKTANEQGLLNGNDVQLLQYAVDFCSGLRNLPPMYFKRIMEVREKISKAQIKV